MTPNPIRVARDPLLDPTYAERITAALRRWAPGVAFIVVLLAAQGLVSAWDAQAEASAERAAAAEARTDLDAKIQAHREMRGASATCPHIYWLVESQDSAGAQAKLLAATMAIDGVRGELRAADGRP